MAEAPSSGRHPFIRGAPLYIGLRYLLKKKLSYLAILGVALSVGVIIVVMSVFTGFHREFTAAIRGYLSDMSVRPFGGGMYGMEDWELWRRAALEASEHVEGASPFIEGAGLLRVPATGEMVHVMFRGVHPELEGTVSRLEEYMEVGSLADLARTYPNPEGGWLRAAFVGKEFFRDSPPDITENPRELILVTATPDLRRALAKYAVNGIFMTGNAEYDSKFVILGLRAAADLVDSGGAVSGLNLRLDDFRHAEAVRDELAEKLGPGALLGRVEPGGSMAALSGDGGRLAVVTPDGALAVRDIRTEETLLSLPPPGQEVGALALDPDGSLVVLGLADGTVVGLEVETAEEAFRHESGEAVTAAAFDPFGFHLAVGRRDGRLQLYDGETGESLGAGRSPGGPVNDIGFDHRGERAVSASVDGTVRVWDAETARLLGEIPDEEGAEVTAAAFSPDGQFILIGRADGALTLHFGLAAEPFMAWHSPDGPVMAAGFGGNSHVVLSAGPQGLTGWNLGRREGRSMAWERFRVPVEDGRLSGAAFDTGGARALLVPSGGDLRLHYTGRGHAVSTWQEERRTFLEAVQMERFLQGLIMSLILVLAEFFIFAIITTMVYEKRRDIGILKAVGFTSGQICLVFLVCGLAIGVIGAAIGVGGGVLFADNINVVRDVIRAGTGWDPFPSDVYYFTEIPSHVGFLTPVITAGGAVLCSLIFSIIPALRAARMDPVRTLHYE